MLELLQKESDGSYRTQSGFCAVIPRVVSGLTHDGKNKYFEFKSSPLASTIRIEWPKDAPIAIFDNDVAQLMLKNNYAYNLTDEHLEEYNNAVRAAPADPAPASSEFPPEGWLPHPTTAGYFYKGQEVLTEAQLRAKVAAPT